MRCIDSTWPFGDQECLSFTLHPNPPHPGGNLWLTLEEKHAPQKPILKGFM